MKRRTNLTVVIAVACALVAGRAFAQELPVHESTDRSTGATVKVYRTVTGPRIEVTSATVSLTKLLAPGGVIVTNLRDAKESLHIEVSEAQMLVNGTRGQVTVVAGDKVAAERARDLVGKSPLTRRAAELIGKMAFVGASPVEPLLLTTRAFLMAATRDGSGLNDVLNWMKATRARSYVVRAVLPTGAQRSSTQCYNEYCDELLNAFDQFVDCFNHIKWYDPFFPEQRCEVTYEVRILAAFAGWMRCLGLGEPVEN